jgi:hypothetical protein
MWGASYYDPTMPETTVRMFMVETISESEAMIMRRAFFQKVLQFKFKSRFLHRYNAVLESEENEKIMFIKMSMQRKRY